MGARKASTRGWGAARGLGFRAIAVDALVAALCAALALASVVGRIQPIGSEEFQEVSFVPADALGVSLVLLSAGALLIRRRYPFGVLVTVATSFFFANALGYVPPPLPAAELVMVCTVASTMSAFVSVAGTALTVASIVAADLIHDSVLNDDKLMAFLLSLFGAWLLGYVIRTSRAQAAMAQENVELLTREQAAATAMAVKLEQERITRDLHDVVAHSVGVMVAQASAARLVFASQPDYASEALAAIETTGRAALAEMRVLLRVLSSGVDDTDEGARPLPPRLDELPMLIQRTRAAGLAVQLVTGGIPRPLPPIVEMAAYRIVQESLTNASKHAGKAQATVRIGYGKGVLDVCICDDGAGQPGTDPGRGLMGMRQRASLLGGKLIAGRGPQGFQVRALLPFAEEVPWRSESSLPTTSR